MWAVCVSTRERGRSFSAHTHTHRFYFSSYSCLFLLLFFLLLSNGSQREVQVIQQWNLRRYEMHITNEIDESYSHSCWQCKRFQMGQEHLEHEELITKCWRNRHFSVFKLGWLGVVHLQSNACQPFLIHPLFGLEDLKGRFAAILWGRSIVSVQLQWSFPANTHLSRANAFGQNWHVLLVISC